MKKYSVSKVSLFVLLAAVTTGANARETGWLERQPGFVGDVMGAKVESVEVLEDGQQKILVSVPESEVSDTQVIEEVLVTAPYPEDLEIESATSEPPRYEFVKDYEQGRYGFVIYLGKNRDFPFRIHFAEDDSQPMRGIDQ